MLVRSNFITSVALWWFLVNIWTVFSPLIWKHNQGTEGKRARLCVVGPGPATGEQLPSDLKGDPVLAVSSYFSYLWNGKTTDDCQGLFLFYNC